jgi:hypothetical protein
VNPLLANLPAALNETGFLQSLVVLLILGLAAGKLFALTARDEYAKQFEILLFTSAVVVRFIASLLIYEFGLMEVIKDEDAYGWMGGVVLHGDWVRRDVGIFGVLYECVTPFFIRSATTATNTWSVLSSISQTFLPGFRLLRSEISAGQRL